MRFAEDHLVGPKCTRGTWTEISVWSNRYEDDAMWLQQSRSMGGGIHCAGVHGVVVRGVFSQHTWTPQDQLSSD